MPSFSLACGLPYYFAYGEDKPHSELFTVLILWLQARYLFRSLVSWAAFVVTIGLSPQLGLLLFLLISSRHLQLVAGFWLTG